MLNGADEVDRHMADYLVLGDKRQLPPAGILGVSLEEKDGEGRIRSLTPKGAAAKAGLKAGDVLTDIDGQTVKNVADMHLALWDKKPGDRVRVTVRRKRTLGTAAPRTFTIGLAAPGGGV